MKYLGIIIDSKLSFSRHTSQIISKITHKLIIFQQIRPFLTIEDSKKFYISYVRPLLEYCPVLLCSINKTQTLQIERLQNKALRIITYNFDQSMTRIRQQFRIPTLESRRIVFLLIKTFDIIHGKITTMKFTELKINSPTRNLRSKNKLLLNIPKFNKVNFGQRSFNYLAPKHWNALPIQIRQIKNRSKFISSIKEHIYVY